MFVSTDGRRACRHGVIGSTMVAYPRDTGSNPVEGNGHFFPPYRQLYLSSFSDTHTHQEVKKQPSVYVLFFLSRCACFHGLKSYVDSDQEHITPRVINEQLASAASMRCQNFESHG